MSDDHFRRVRERIRAMTDEPKAALPHPVDLEQLASVLDGALQFDDLGDDTLRRLIDSLGLDGVTDLLVPAEAYGIAAARTTAADGPTGREASRAFAVDWPDLDLALASCFSPPRPVPPAGPGAPRDLPFDLHRAGEAADVAVEAGFWRPEDGAAPILLHRFRRPGNAASRAWSLYLPAAGPDSEHLEPFGLWAAPVHGGFRFDLLLHRRPEGPLVLGLPDDGVLTRLWIDPTGEGIARSGWRREPGGSWRVEPLGDVGVLEVGAWTERQRAAAAALRRRLDDL